MATKRKLLLTYPNQRWQKDDANTVWDMNPATLCLLGTVVTDIVDVKVVDAQFYNMSQESFAEEIRNFHPDFVGISVMSSEYREILDIAAEIIKNIDPNIIVIAGGVHVTTSYEYVVKNENIDYCVRGEGEYTLRELLKHLVGEGEFPKEGLVFMKSGTMIAQNHVLVQDVSKLPWPAYDLVDFKAYVEKPPRPGPGGPALLPYTRMVTTRGCPFDCSFCQVAFISGKPVRARSADDVVNELEFLKENYGIKSILFEDDNLLMAKKYTRELFSLMIRRNLNLKWFGSAFALWCLNDEVLDLMRDSGCIGINIAIESGNERVLRDIVHKPIKDLKRVPEIIEKVKSRGMFCISNFIIGFPGETWEEVRETINFAEHCGSEYVKFFIAVPLYGTEMYHIAKRMNLLTHNDEYPRIDWRYSQIKSDEWTTKDISILRAYEWDRINFSKDRIGRTAEIWRMSIDDLNIIRKRTRDSLTF